MAGRKIHPFDGTYQEKFKHKCGFSIAIIYYLRLLECKWQVKKKVASVKHHSSPMLQSANIPLPLAAPSKPWNMKRAGLLYTTGRVFAGSRSTWTCQGMAMPPTETHDKMTASCGKPYGIFARKNHSSAETFAAELPPEKLANHAFSDEFSEAEKTHQFLSVQLPAASQTWGSIDIEKKHANKNRGHIGVTVFSLSASSTEKHSMKPTAISSPEKIGQPCSPKKEKFIDSNQHHWNFFQGQTAKELAVFVCRFLGTSIYPPEV